MKYIPHDYQTRATNFILEHPKAGMLLEMGLGKTVITMTATTYDNGTGVIPSYLCEPVFADASNYKELLIDSGYYTEADLQ